MNITVSCHAGHRSEETPRSFRIHDREIVISEVLDRWLSPDHRYFKVRGNDTDVYILRHDPNAGKWELVFYTGT